jgi:hypothetical protein
MGFPVVESWVRWCEATELPVGAPEGATDFAAMLVAPSGAPTEDVPGFAEPSAAARFTSSIVATQSAA